MCSVIPGDTISGAAGSEHIRVHSTVPLLRGYNTFNGVHPSDEALLCEGSGEVVSAISGKVEVLERMVSVKGKSNVYLPEIGDVVVGRIVAVSGVRWLVDIGACQHAVLLLANVTEPGGMLRRRNRGDELGMRRLFDESDLIAAEVQRISADGVVSLHTRLTERFGRLTHCGKLVVVSPSLITRAKKQFSYFDHLGCSVIFAMNGFVWVEVTSDANARGPDSDCDSARMNGARLGNIIRVLGREGCCINASSVLSVFESSVDAGLSAFDVTRREVVANLIDKTSSNALS